MTSSTEISGQACFQRYCAECAAQNNEILEQFLHLEPGAILRRSHLFEGRYENIYVRNGAIGNLRTITEKSLYFAAGILERDPATIKVGWWFNYMQPGQRTIAHRHDDDDELLSAVYYIHVPPDSGKLLLYGGHPATEVIPREGNFIFFRPDLLHEVTLNNSSQPRLSLGMNFGPRISNR